MTSSYKQTNATIKYVEVPFLSFDYIILMSTELNFSLEIKKPCCLF